MFVIWIGAERELCVPHFLAIPLVFNIVDGLKGNFIICFSIFKLPCKDHVNIHAEHLKLA